MPFCRKCGVELQEDDKFCPNCGATFTPAKVRTVATEKEEVAPEVVEPAKVAPPPQPAVEPAKVTPTATAAPAKGKHTNVGYASLFMGIVGILVFFVPITPSDKIPVIFLDIVIGGVAAAFGGKAVDRGDNFGTIGLIIAAIVIILCIVTVLF